MKAEESKVLTLRRESGFTLMELMIVIAILAILVGIVAPRMMGGLDEANVAAAKAQISNFKTSLTAYKIKIKKYPSSGEGLNALINNSKNQNFLDGADVPKDPWDNDYIYTCPGTHNMDFEIVSYGADGAPGGTGYDADIESWNLKGNE